VAHCAEACAALGGARRAACLALDVKVILIPPCIFR
jgi:hypothetical protein